MAKKKSKKPTNPLGGMPARFSLAASLANLRDRAEEMRLSCNSGRESIMWYRLSLDADHLALMLERRGDGKGK